ncbi:MAG TPA: hypothetical protein DC001_04410 [Clostridiales bacterium]|jgi:hypothetical protein|nr:hypothetical protein [Clostridiales bacterium]HBR07966.1 hypothetical protein [Clostridiales bacterium]
MNAKGAGNLNARNDYWSRLKAYQKDMPAEPLSPSCNWRQSVPAALTNSAGMEISDASPPPAPVTLESTNYMAGLLTTMVGEQVRVQFLIGTTGPLIDVMGTLLQVGANYIVIQPIATDDLMICDLYSIKFVTVLK